jgi:hypothetical protein
MRWIAWACSATAAILLLAPTYGIGVALAPLTLIGSWIALRSPRGTASQNIRTGVAVNSVVVVGILCALIAVNGFVGWLKAAIVVLVIPASLLLTTFTRRAS